MLLYFPKLPVKVCKRSFQITPLNREHCVLLRKKKKYVAFSLTENLERGMAGLTENVLLLLTIIPLIFSVIGYLSCYLTAVSSVAMKAF